MSPKRICLGIPCFQHASPETLEDYMRFAFYLGRKYTEFDFFLAIKSKSEQFRARNYIAQAALSAGCDYLFMLDDDQVINWQENYSSEPNSDLKPYEFLRELISHMKDGVGIVGALYYQRDPDYKPVLLEEDGRGGYVWMKETQIDHRPQVVDVTGGGCMLIDMNVFTKIRSPWFEPEFQFGTDVQICERARKAGYKVVCDTSIVLGHVRSSREVVCPQNRQRLLAAAQTTDDASPRGMDPQWEINSAIGLYTLDAMEYLGLENYSDVLALADTYFDHMGEFEKYGNKRDYYRGLGKEQVARQVWFHNMPHMREEFGILLSNLAQGREFYGLDFGCGSAPVGLELVMRGYRMDFVDIDGTPAYEFLKWRVKKRALADRAAFGWGSGPYDFVMMLDSLEHLENWKDPLGRMIRCLKPNGLIVTNFFMNQDYENPEHINMDKKGVREFLVAREIYPINELAWIKGNLAQKGMAA